MTTADAVKTRVLQEIDRRADEYVEVCCRLLRFNTENPPSNNTTDIADFVSELLRRRGVTMSRVEPEPGLIDLTATIEGRRDHPHFVFNGLPTVIYGPRPHNIAALNESVPVDEYLTELKVHAATAIDFLWQAPA